MNHTAQLVAAMGKPLVGGAQWLFSPFFYLDSDTENEICFVESPSVFTGLLNPILICFDIFFYTAHSGNFALPSGSWCTDFSMYCVRMHCHDCMLGPVLSACYGMPS